MAEGADRTLALSPEQTSITERGDLTRVMSPGKNSVEEGEGRNRTASAGLQSLTERGDRTSILSPDKNGKTEGGDRMRGLSSYQTSVAEGEDSACAASADQASLAEKENAQLIDRKWIVCTGCLRDRDAKVETVKYCVQCNENLCKTCLREHIRKTSSYRKGHTLLSGDELPASLTVASMRIDDGSKCETHPDNMRTMYCVDHQRLVCGACIVLHHGSCENVIDTEAPLVDETTEVNRDDLIQVIREARASVDDLVRIRRKDQSKLRRITAASLASVREFRSRVNKLFDNLEKKASDDINSFCIEHDDKIEHDIRALEKQDRLLELSSNNTAGISEVKSEQATDNTREIEKALETHNCKKVVSETNAACDQVRTKAKESFPQFEVNQSLSRYLKTLKSIGDLVYERRCDAKENIDIQTVQLLHEEGKLTDTKTVSIAPFHSRKVLLTDSENCSIKILDEHFSEVRRIPLEATDNPENIKEPCIEPYASCYISEEKVAVSIEQAKLVKIVDLSLNPNECEYSDISMGDICRGLRYNELYEELYVCCGGGAFLQEGLGHVGVFKLTGERIRNFKTNPRTKQPLFSCPFDVAISNTGSTIYVSDKQKGILSFDRQGRLLATFTPGLLDEPRGVCVDFNNHVIVCGHLSDNVIELDENLEDARVLLDNGRIHSPRSIAFLPFNSKFVVTFSNEGSVLVFKRK